MKSLIKRLKFRSKVKSIAQRLDQTKRSKTRSAYQKSGQISQQIKRSRARLKE